MNTAKCNSKISVTRSSGDNRKEDTLIWRWKHLLKMVLNGVLQMVNQQIWAYLNFGGPTTGASKVQSYLVNQ